MRVINQKVSLPIGQRHPTYIENLTPLRTPGGNPVRHSRPFFIEPLGITAETALLQVKTGSRYFSVRQKMQGIPDLMFEVPSTQLPESSPRVFYISVQEGDTLFVRKSGGDSPGDYLLEEDVIKYGVKRIAPDSVTLDIKAQEFTPD